MFRARMLLTFNAKFFKDRFDLQLVVPPVWTGMSAERDWQQYPLHFVVAVGNQKDITAALNDLAKFTGQCGRDSLPEGHVSVNDWHRDTLKTPLDFAVHRGDPEIVSLLLKRGARPSPLTVRLAEELVQDVQDPTYADRMHQTLQKVHSRDEAEAVLKLVGDAYRTV
eukprot:EG_transcript_28804